jgi:hypothetical protein
MNLNSLTAKSWPVVSNSPVEILSSDQFSFKPPFIAQLNSDRIDLLNMQRKVVLTLPCNLNLEGCTLSVSDDEQYLYIKDESASMTVSIKREADGVVVDLWVDGGDEPEATTYEFYSAFLAEEDL